MDWMFMNKKQKITFELYQPLCVSVTPNHLLNLVYIYTQKQ